MSKVLVARLAARDRKLAQLSATNFETQEEVVAEIFGLPPPSAGRAFIACKDLPTTLMAPLFYDQSVVFLCRHNGIAQRPSLLRWMGERGLIFPVMESGYGWMPPASLVALNAIPHASHAAFHTFERISAELEGTTFPTIHEIANAVKPFDHLSRNARHAVLQALDFLTSLPEGANKVGIDILNEAIESGQLEQIETAGTVFRAASRVTQAGWLQATPQLALDGVNPSSEASAELDLVAESLNISYSEKTEDAQTYLRAIEPYRGSLAFLLKPGASVEKALETVDQINVDLRRMISSRRMRVLSAITNVFARRPTEGLEKFANALGASPTAVTAAKAAISAGAAVATATPRLRNAALAAYFQTNVKTVQIWRIQERLARH